MTVMLALTGAAGIALFVTGLPVWRVVALDRRVVGQRRPTFVGWLRSHPRSPFSPGKASELEPLLWGVALAGVTFLVSVVGGGQDQAARGAVLSLCSFIAAFLWRSSVLRAANLRRTRRLEERLPAVLDLLTIAVMSGESIQGAVKRVGDVLSGELGDLFRRVSADVRSGSDVETALGQLSERAAVPALARTVDALLTALDRGAPVAEVLKGQAEDLRSDMRARLLESGGRREVLMLVPVVFLILPVVVLFALYPGLVTLDLLTP